jgi:hypothetical protein
VIVTAAKIVGNNSDGDFVGGYEWCIEQVRNSTYLELASGLEIQKAIAYLREDNFPKVRRKNLINPYHYNPLLGYLNIERI